MRRAWIAAAALVAAGCGAPRGDAPRARSVDAFVDSVGVNVHMSYYDTAYARFDEWSARLRELGVRHVRDGLVFDDPVYVERYRRLAAEGVRASFIAPPDRPAAASVALAAGPLRPAVDELEGPNEPDLGSPAGWVQRTRRTMAGLAAAKHALPGVPLAGPSLTSEDGVHELARDGGSVNLHPYPGGRPPRDALETQLGWARAADPGAPVVVTEDGYHDAPFAASGQPAVTAQAAAAYVPRVFLEAFAAGVRRTYLYELLDEKPDPGGTDPEQHFGLLRNDLTPKPAFVSLQALLRALRTSPGPGERRQVRVVAGAEVGQLLLERRDGSRALVLWRRAVAGAGEPPVVHLRFDGEPGSVRVYTAGARPGETSPRVRGGRLDVALGDAAVVVSFR